MFHLPASWLMPVSLEPHYIMVAKFFGCHLAKKSIAVFISFDTKGRHSYILHWIDLSFFHWHDVEKCIVFDLNELLLQFQVPTLASVISLVTCRQLSTFFLILLHFELHIIAHFDNFRLNNVKFYCREL